MKAEHPELGTFYLYAERGAELLFCENETNNARLWGTDASTPYPKDGINDHVVHGAATVNPAGEGTKAAAHVVCDGPGRSAGRRPAASHPARARGAPRAVRQTSTATRDAPERGRRVLRLDHAARRPAKTPDWSCVRRSPACSGRSRRTTSTSTCGSASAHAHPLRSPNRRGTRNESWFHMVNHDVISMPDKWEYPWYAAWDLAFHCVALAMVDPDFAKNQLRLMLSQRYLHPSGQMPAYEWNFGDVNPPVHAFATLFSARDRAAVR